VHLTLLSAINSRSFLGEHVRNAADSIKVITGGGSLRISVARSRGRR